jgi:hypothetical protein
MRLACWFLWYSGQLLGIISTTHTHELVDMVDIVDIVSSLGMVPTKMLQYLCDNESFSDTFRSACHKMLSDVPNHPIQYTLDSCMESPIGHRITSVSVEPIGSGSVAQVHTCLLDKTISCVVKVRHPFLRTETFLLTHIVSTLLFIWWYVTGYGIDGTRLMSDLYNQTDLTIEGEYTSKVHDIITSEIGTSCGIQSPLVLYATTDILLMSNQPGVHPYMDRIGYQNMEYTTRKTGGFFVYMAVIHGFCHGDLHAGNILFDELTQVVSIIDHGSCIRIPTYDRNPLIILIECTFNPDASTKSVFDLFFPTEHFRSEYIPAMKEIIDVSWNGTPLMMVENVKRFAALRNLLMDSTIAHFLVQYTRTLEATSQSFHATSPFPDIAVMVHEAIQIAENSISRSKATHVLFLQSFYTKLICSAGRLCDLE